MESVAAPSVPSPPPGPVEENPQGQRNAQDQDASGSGQALPEYRFRQVQSMLRQPQPPTHPEADHEEATHAANAPRLSRHSMKSRPPRYTQLTMLSSRSENTPVEQHPLRQR